MNNKFIKIIDNLQKEIDILEKKADDNIPVPLSLEDLSSLVNKIVTKSKESWFTIGSSYYAKLASTKEHVDQYLKTFYDQYEFTLKELESLHTTNIEKIEHNKVIISKIKLIMQHIGINDQYSKKEYSKRSMTPKYITATAGYIEDLNRVIKTDDYYSTKLSAMKSYKNTIESFSKELKAKIYKEETDKLKIKNEQAKVQAINYLKVKYDCPYDATDNELLITIIDKDTYLALAYEMEYMRNDWTAFPDRVQFLLGELDQNDSLQKLIYQELANLVYDWDEDGRVFRDCQYNYSYIYSLVPEELMKDFELLRNHMDIFS